MTTNLPPSPFGAAEDLRHLEDEVDVTARADKAEVTLRGYMLGAGDDLETAASDLIADLFHLADREGWTIDRLLERAHLHHDAEHEHSWQRRTESGSTDHVWQECRCGARRD